MRSSKKTLLSAVVLSATLGWSTATVAETWTDATGKFKLEAKFLGAQDGTVALQKEDGSKIFVPFDKLDQRSQTQARELYGKMKAAAAASPAADQPAATRRAAVSPAMNNTSAPLGKSKFGANPTAEETVEILTRAMEESDLVTLWDSLPKKYQNDINQNTQMLAKNVDPMLWNGVGDIVKKLGRVLSEKKQFILGNENVGAFLPQDPKSLEIWDAAADAIQAVGNSSLTSHGKMQRFSVEGFLQSDGRNLASSFRALSKLMEDPSGDSTAGVPKMRVVSSDAQSAVVEVTRPDGDVETRGLVKVDNRWVPDDMAKEWDEQMQKAREGLQKIGSPEGKQQMMNARMMLGMVGGPLDSLLAASSQSEFDQAFNPVFNMVSGMVGQMMPGGPGGMGPGGFGPGGIGAGGFDGGGFDAGDAVPAEFGADAFGQ
ncbi:SHD1 domain-containing protein [Stieleria varia]|uniref:SLA1 homology domain-containing protein n=1 Tax=Stieleria varia TaxID=2528005 RepID=A0A5C6A094_9BACT|nr:SHD1 domain-containing protein [Stieleria varia]TWT93242.1 hypothetical protein Pla52n_59000 [Stieleria varia]